MQYLLQEDSSSSLSSSSLLLQLQRTSSFSNRQQFRNAEIIKVPENVSTIAALAGVCGCCGIYNVLYEISRPEDAEWCDSTRRVCVVFEGEVVLVGLAAVASVFGLNVKKVAMNVKGPCSSSSAPFYPSIYLDPRKWENSNDNHNNFRVFVSGASPNVGNRKLKAGSEVLILRSLQNQLAMPLANQDGAKATQNKNDSQTAAGVDDKQIISSQFTMLQRRQRRKNITTTSDSKEKWRKQHLHSNSPYETIENMQRLMISVLTESKDEVKRAAMTNTAVITSAPSSTTKVNDQDDKEEDLTMNHEQTERNEGEGDAKKEDNQQEQEEQPVHQPSSSHLFLQVDEETFIDDMMYRVQQQSTRHKPLENLFPHHQIFIGETIWKRIHAHAFAATIFASSSSSDGMMMGETMTTAQASVAGESQQQGSVMNFSLVSGGGGSEFQQIRRSRPQRRIFAMCSIGQPSEESLKLVAEKLVSEKESSSTESFHLHQQIPNQDVSFVLFIDMPTLHSCATSKKYVIEILSTLEKSINRNFLQPLSSYTKEIDVIITCASRFIPSPVRFPESALYHKLFVKEMRGGQEVLESASMMVSLNSDLMCSWLIGKFAETTNGISFKKLGEFLDGDGDE